MQKDKSKDASNRDLELYSRDDKGRFVEMNGKISPDDFNKMVQNDARNVIKIKDLFDDLMENFELKARMFPGYHNKLMIAIKNIKKIE